MFKRLEVTLLVKISHVTYVTYVTKFKALHNLLIKMNAGHELQPPGNHGYQT